MRSFTILAFLMLFIVSMVYAFDEFYERVIDIPSVESLPDADYPNIAPVIWQGGDEKFGKWRNFFNGEEMGWGLTYNSHWNYKTNTWEGRDSGDPRANICAYIRFNVCEGNLGGNTFEINFAKGGEVGETPDWNSGSHFFFYDGNSDTKAPAVMQIHGPGNVDTMIQLCPNEGNNPSWLNLRNSGDGKFRIERQVFGSEHRGDFYTALRIPLMTFDKNNGWIGINNDSPKSPLDVVGGITIRATTMPPEIDTDETMTLWMDKITGNVMIRIIHNGEVRQGAVVNFKGLPLN